MSGVFTAGDDLCLSFWSIAYNQGWITFPPNAKVLEIGCAEADWQTPMLAVRPDLQITGIDWRACERPGTTIQGDVLRHQFPAESFDCIVSVSAIEHIGLGAYNADPMDEYGDRRAMSNAHLWLKPGGWMYLDVPFRTTCYEEHDSYRAYTKKALLKRLLAGFEVEHWAECRVEHPDAPYIALLLRKGVNVAG